VKQNVWKKNLCSEIWDSLVGMKIFVYHIVSLFILVVNTVVFGTAHTVVFGTAHTVVFGTAHTQPSDISFQKT